MKPLLFFTVFLSTRERERQSHRVFLQSYTTPRKKNEKNARRRRRSKRTKKTFRV
jgi:hypothetical protein